MWMHLLNIKSLDEWCYRIFSKAGPVRIDFVTASKPILEDKVSSSSTTATTTTTLVHRVCLPRLVMGTLQDTPFPILQCLVELAQESQDMVASAIKFLEKKPGQEAKLLADKWRKLFTDYTRGYHSALIQTERPGEIHQPKPTATQAHISNIVHSSPPRIGTELLHSSMSPSRIERTLIEAINDTFSVVQQYIREKEEVFDKLLADTGMEVEVVAWRKIQEILSSP
ncbi:uncharacterized protein I206_107880 [Kwoniella pini CBS 10737]|uniref:Uncharacterized protein n=1 Tax=Kwoniella pini CBS 10737 TaxID=1296096 RepID=A0A1B9HYI8_9TREE|nr:uncharacterized protein I206_06213 [Kwoniella pini CBS 10737]OCF48345.1 hypothetical protein I206_06213 [Kwoniella pini CBS 10737]